MKKYIALLLAIFYTIALCADDDSSQSEDRMVWLLEPIYVVAKLWKDPTSFWEKAYAEVGFGMGFTNHTYDGKNITDWEGYNGSSLGTDFGLKLGLNITEKPLFITIGYDYLSRNTTAKPNGGELQNSFSQHYIAPGIIFYPHEKIQLSAGIGFAFGSVNEEYKFPAGDKTFKGKSNHDINTGIAFDLTVAYEIFPKKHSMLIGVKLFNTFNTVNDKDLSTMNVGGFVKYRISGKK